MKKINLVLFFVFVLLVFVTTVSAYCGDGILDTSEECDDGNLINGDRCSADCKIEKVLCKFAGYAEATSENPAGSLAIYATGAPNAPKVGQCSEWSGYGYTWSPQNWNIKANLTLFYDEAVYVTNFTLYGDYDMCWSRMWLKNSATGEERIVFNGINTQCESVHVLNGSFLADVLILETCGTSWSSTDAVQLCKTPTTCGNNIIGEGEGCDDGNLINGDGCSVSCKIEECICNDDCNHLDKDYCNGDTITHDEGICVNYMCEVNTIIVEDCDNKIMIMNDCGRLQWGCSEELNDVHCALINIRPDDSLCPSYCSGDIAKDGKCTALTYRCVYDEVDCNTYDNNYCCGTKIMHDDYICSAAKCILNSTTVKECDNNLVCDGQETCLNERCVNGARVDCSQYDINGISTCFNDPDNIKFTFDFRNSFTSQCTEPFGICTKGDLTIIHSCDEIRCGAECDEDVDCKATDCDYLDGCRGRDYYDYSDVANSCLRSCECTDNQCGDPKIYYNDPRCGECDNDDECNRLDKDYCDGNLVKHDEGRCVDYNCIAETNTVEDCDDLDRSYCDGTLIKNEDFTCVNAECVMDLIVTDCDNSLYCDGQETCLNERCVDGTLVDCSDNNLDPIATCYNIPDNIGYTWDYFAGFISECDEERDRCTTGSISLTHTCDKVKCGAECAVKGDCPEKCTSSHKLYTVIECNDCKCDYSSYRCIVGKCGAECDENTDCSCKKDYCDGITLVDYPEHGICGTSGAEGCLCQVSESVEGECKPTLIPRSPQCGECENDDECNRLDRDYCDGNLVKHDEGRCVDYNCIAETNIVEDCDDLDRSYCDGTLIKNEDFTCVNAECVMDLIVTDCDNSLYCDGQETCSNAECVDGMPIDCSRYDLDPIEKCSNIPDGNYFTFDYFAGFISECDEEENRCTTGRVELTHTCDSDRCNAPCEEDSDCEMNEICDLSTCRCECVPEEEVCDGMDNDCDGFIDEHLTRDCGVGDCIGTQDCTNGIWSICSSYQYDCGVCCICDEDGLELYDETQDNDCYLTICPDSGCGLNGCDMFEFALFPYSVPNECFDLKECSENECEAECYDEDLLTDDLSFRSEGGILEHIGPDTDFAYTSKIDFSGWLRKEFDEKFTDGVASLEVITETKEGKRVVLNIRVDSYDSTIGCDEVYVASNGRGTYWKTEEGIKTLDCELEYWIDRIEEKIDIQGSCGGITFRIDDIGNLVFV